jgi:hypothetical protein
MDEDEVEDKDEAIAAVYGRRSRWRTPRTRSLT